MQTLIYLQLFVSVMILAAAELRQRDKQRDYCQEVNPSCTVDDFPNTSFWKRPGYVKSVNNNRPRPLILPPSPLTSHYWENSPKGELYAFRTYFHPNQQHASVPLMGPNKQQRLDLQPMYHQPLY